MLVRSIDKFTDSADLIVTVECVDCGASHRMLVPDGAWNEHDSGCPLADRTAYIADWAYMLSCPTCGEGNEYDSDVAHCVCGESRDKRRIGELAAKAFARLHDRKPGCMSGWLYADGYLGIMEENRRTASIELNEDAERGGEAYPSFSLTVNKRGKNEPEYKTVYSADIELPRNAGFDAYLSAVNTLKEKAELVFNILTKTRVHESLDETGAVIGKELL